MANVMDKFEFCECLEMLKKYAAWENILYENGIDLTSTPVADLVEKFHMAMCGFDTEWSYDPKMDFDWIIEWCFNVEPYVKQIRHGKEWYIGTASGLYDFLVYMNTYGWDAD
jgi:hypothetical protein